TNASGVAPVPSSALSLPPAAPVASPAAPVAKRAPRARRPSTAVPIQASSIDRIRLRGARSRSPGAVIAVAFSPDEEQVLAATSAGSVSIVELADVRSSSTIFVLQGGATAAAFSKDGRRAVLGGGQGMLCLLDRDRGDHLMEFALDV